MTPLRPLGFTAGTPAACSPSAEKMAVDVERMAEDIKRPTLDLAMHLLRTNDEKYVDGHNRLRETLDKLAATLDILGDKLDANIRLQELVAAKLDTVEKRKVDISNIRLTLPMFVAGVGLCAVIIGGQKFSTWGFAEKQSDTQHAVELLNERLNSQKMHDDDVAKIQDIRAERLTDDEKTLRGQVTMIDTWLRTQTGRKEP
jgi:hypothetical protein